MDCATSGRTGLDVVRIWTYDVRPPTYTNQKSGNEEDRINNL